MTDFHLAAEANQRRSRWLLLLMTAFTLLVGLTVDAALRSTPFVTILALMGMGVALLLARTFGDWIVLASLRASEPDANDPEHKQLVNVVNEMAVASGLPQPRVLVIRDPAPNALATGLDPSRATIAVTTGLLEKLDRAQTQAVVAHEMAHIGNRDTRLGVMVAVMVGTIALLADVAWRIQPSRSRRSDSGQDPLAILLPILLLATVLAPVASRLIAFAISRQREYLADATAVAFTRNPVALANALEAISADRRPTQAGTRGTAHLFFVRPAASGADERDGFLADLFATHPPIAERIARLRGMSYQGSGEPGPGA